MQQCNTKISIANFCLLNKMSFDPPLNIFWFFTFSASQSNILKTSSPVATMSKAFFFSRLLRFSAHKFFEMVKRRMRIAL